MSEEMGNSEQKPYVVSARKYRPATFKTVVGQRALTATLKNAIDSQRLAQAYLFCGPRGVGKTSCARIFAKTINCLSPTADGEACGVCESCRAIEQGNSFNLVELDAASNNSVDDIRSITDQVNVPPQTGRYRVFIIDEVHMLSNAAFNAFLKTLEEPPKYVVFILATTEKHKVIPTILSRCQIYDFKRITINDMVDHLEYVASQEGITTDRDALGIIALKADGAMRDALSIFDQVAASSRGNVTYANTIENLNVLDYDCYFRLIEACRDGNVADALLIYKEVRDKGFDSLFMVNGLAGHVRDLMVAADPRTVSLLETSDEIAARYVAQAKTLPVEWYYTAMKLLSDCDLNFRTATNKRLLVELTLIRMCQLLKPVAPPFDAVDRPVVLRDPVQPYGNVSPGAQPVQPHHNTGTQGAQPHHNTGAQGMQAAPAQSAPQAVPPAAPASAAAQAPPAQGPSGKGAQVSTGKGTQMSAGKPAPVSSGRTAVNRPATFKLTDRQTQASTTHSGLQQRTTPITDERFRQGWGEFIARNPQLHILVNTMRSAQPQRDGDTSYRIIVDHPAQLQAFELSMPKLLEYLREYLANDLLVLKVEVNSSPVENKQLPPKEFLRQVVTDNPAMGRFLSAIDGELM